MAATVNIMRWTGPSGSPTKTNITNTANRLSVSDDALPGSTNPIPIPIDTSTVYSFWAATRLNVSVAPVGTINNIKWYSDGTNTLGSGVDIKGNTATSYVQATGTVGSTGNQLTTTEYSTITSPVSVFTFTSLAPKSVTGSITASTGDLGDFFVYQLSVGSVASPGTTPSETFFYMWDET